MCENNNWNLTSTKTRLGFPYVIFFGFTADKGGYRLSDQNLDPICKMVPLTNLSELRHILGVFLQSKDDIPIVDKCGYGQIAKFLTALTSSRNGQPIPFDWMPECQSAFDTIRNYLLDVVHLAPVYYRCHCIVGGMHQKTANHLGYGNSWMTW